MRTLSKKMIAKENGSLLNYMTAMGHEQLVFCQDEETDLKAIIAIHDTTLGPALGGTRMWNYSNSQDAVDDVLRLSRGMTYKAAISGLNLGGGKAVIIGDSSTQKNESLMRRFGKFVDSLGGKYITAEDVGMSPVDMEYVRQETKFVTGIPESMGGSGDPSPFTAYGVYMGIKASAKYKWGSDDLTNKRILVQGIGSVGEHLVKHLCDEGANVIINDINQEKVRKIVDKFHVDSISETQLYDLDIDVYAPCALGAVLNPQTIPSLNCCIVAGAANNQLQDEERDANLLLKKDILYAPDFLINAGGLINVYSELQGYNKEESLRKTKEIYNTTLEIYKKAEIEQITTHQAAYSIAAKKIADRKLALKNA